MKIKKLIAEEVKLILLENNILKAMEGVPPEELEAAIVELTPIVQAELPKYAEENAQEGAVAEGVGESLQQGMAKLLTVIPGGRDLGAMYLAAIDKATDPKIRTLFLVALVNLISPIDLGTILSGGLIEFLGPLTALDDVLLVRKVLGMMKEQGLPSEKHHTQLAQLAGEESEEDVIDVEATEIEEQRMISVSRINRIIKEELEVVLTNEEAQEIFELDATALIDELMDEGAYVPAQTIRRKDDPLQQMTSPGYSLRGDETGEERKGKEKRQEKPLQKWKKTQGLEEEKDDWMDNIKSTGECTPSTKPGCKGRAKAFAKRAQHGDVRDDNLKKGKNPHGPG